MNSSPIDPLWLILGNYDHPILIIHFIPTDVPNIAIASFIDYHGQLMTSQIAISNTFDEFDKALYAADHYFDHFDPVILHD